ncbi:hypothetical protein BH10PSE1_BH10PSE1_30660 [soil metagenome]
MLWVTLTTLMMIDPAVIEPSASAMGPRTTLSASVHQTPDLRVIQPVELPAVPACDQSLHRIGDRFELRRAPTGERVKLYYAFALEVGGCPIPVIARETVPEADHAIGRTIR